LMVFTCLSACQTRVLQRGQVEAGPKANALDRTAIPASPSLTQTAALTVENDLNALTLAGQVYDAGRGPTQGIQGALVRTSGCNGEDFRVSSQADGRYKLFMPGSSLNSCNWLIVQASAAGYRHSTIQSTVDDLRAQPRRDFALQPIPPTATPSNALEAVVLRAMSTNYESLRSSPQVEVNESDPAAVSYRVAYPSAGAWDFAEIVYYSSIAEAETAFAEICPGEQRFHYLPACELPSNPSYNSNSLHYSDTRWIVWLSGRRLYQAITGYHSTYSGAAADPRYLAEPLYQSAVRFGLIQ